MSVTSTPGLRVCVFRPPSAGVLLLPPVTPTHPHTHTRTQSYTYPNVLDVLMLLEILALLMARLPRITPSATALCNPNENSCYILNSQGDAGCLHYHPFTPFSPLYSYLTLRCQIQIHFSEKKVHSEIPTKQENALNPANTRTV